METFIVHLQGFFGWVIQMSYQASVLICLIIVLQLLVGKRIGARWHYWLWVFLIFRMSMPWIPSSPVSIFKIIPGFHSDTIIARSPMVQEQPLISYDSSYPEGIKPTDTAVGAGTTFEEPGKIEDEEIGYSADGLLQRVNIIPLVWLVGAVIFGFYVFTSNFRLWRIIKCQRPLTQQNVLDLLEDCKNLMNVQTVVAVVATDKVKSPALFGFLRPRLLLPNGMIEDFSYDQLRYVFLHELAHLKRHDIFTGWMMAILQTLHWFNPLVFLAFHRMRADRELACDGLALSQMNVDEPKLYGRTIVKLLEKFSQPQILPAVAGILENKSQMKRRITMISQFKKSTYRPGIFAIILMVVFGCIVLTNPDAKSEIAGKGGDSKALAGEFVELLLNQEYGRARENFDSKLKDSMSEAQLKETWGGILEQAGAFKKQLGIRKQKFLASDILFVTCEFANGPLDVKVVYDASKNITSLTFVPTSEEIIEQYTKQPPVKQKAYSEAEIDSKDYEFFFARIGDPEEGYHAFSGLWALENKAKRADETTRKKIIERASEIIDSDRNSFRRWQCSYVISGIGDEYGIPALIHALSSDEDETVRRCAACALGAFESKDAVNALKNASNKEKNREVRSWINRAIDGEFRGQQVSVGTAEPSPSKDIGPIVLETSPAVFANDVESGYQKISVTFDRPMMTQSWSWVGSGEMFPEIKGKPSYDFARRKCTIRTNLEPGRVYRIGINSPSHKFFQTLEQVPAVPYVILFATKDRNGNATPIPEKYISEAKQINAVTESAMPGGGRERPGYSKALSSSEITLSHDDNSSAGKKSIAGSGHGVLFETGGPQSTLTAVRIFCSRYGYPQPPREDFHILLCDENAKVIKDFAFPYSKIQRGDPKWVTLKVRATELPSKFYIFANFNPEQRKGVYVHHDQEASGNSFTGLPGRSINTFEGGDWMIQAVIKQQADSNATLDVESESSRAPVKDVTKKNYLGQTNFPKIVKLEPANNVANVDPELEYITVTFDRPMRGGYSWVDKGSCPKIEKIEWINNQQCRAWVKLEPDKSYGVWLNFGPNTCKFKSEEMVSADRTYWHFRTASKSGTQFSAPASPVKYVTKKNYLGQTNFPEIVKLEPANNSANVDPGLEYITVTFDRPMRGGYSWVDKGKRPKIEKIEWIDEFNCRAWMQLEPNKVYGIWLNFGPNTCKFKSKEGISADRKYWQFRTTQGR